MKKRAKCRERGPQSHTPLAVESFTVCTTECKLGNQDLKMRNANKRVTMIVIVLLNQWLQCKEYECVGILSIKLRFSGPVNSLQGPERGQTTCTVCFKGLSSCL